MAAKAMAAKAIPLPKRFPPGTKYVVEARGAVRGMTLMHRYVEFPDGRRVELAARLVPACRGTAPPVRSATTRRPRRLAGASA